MGSWNTTCAVSSTPIINGSKVRLFFLASNKKSYNPDLKRDSIFNSYLSYPYSAFRVIGGLGVKASYDDYGRFDIEESSIEAQVILNSLKNCYTMNERKEDIKDNFDNEFINIPAEELTFKKIQKMIHANQFFMKSFMSDKIFDFAAVMAIHEDVYNVILNEVTEVYTGNDGCAYDYLTFEDVLNKEVKKYQTWESDCIKEAEKYKSVFSNESDEVIKTQKAMNMAKMMVRYSPDYELHYSNQHFNPLEAMLDLLPNHPEESKESCIKKYGEVKHFRDKMEAHNMMFRPMMTSGQTYDYANDVLFLQKIANAVATLDSGFEEEEHVLTKKCSKMWQEAKLSEFANYIKEIWGDEDKHEYYEQLNEFKEKYKDTKKMIITSEELVENESYGFLKKLVMNKELELHITMDI